MQYCLKYSKAFRRSIKRLLFSGSFDADKFEYIVDILKSTGQLPVQCKDHELKGEYLNSRECHIKGDLLLIYRINHETKMITMVEIGSHSQLFK